MFKKIVSRSLTNLFLKNIASFATKSGNLNLGLAGLGRAGGFHMNSVE